MKTRARKTRKRHRLLSEPSSRHAVCEAFEKRLLMSFTYQHLADFPGTWTNSAQGLVADAQGNLYGTTLGTANPGGTVFKIAAGTGTVSNLASFNSTTGENPAIGLAIDASGNLYGATNSGGANGDGTLFEIAAGSSTITVLASFGTSSGYSLDYGETIILDSSGNIYGTTEAGGTHSSGTVFELPAGSGTITALASFNSSVTGKYSYAPLTIDSSGNLYGTTESGGTNNSGTVFEVAHNSGSITPLVSFNSTSGSQTNVIVDSSGNVYGTAVEGGSSNAGTVFRINAGTGVLTTLATFNITNGNEPEGALVADAAGNLFGATYSGGSNGLGTVFEFSPGNNTISTVYSFAMSSSGGYTQGGVFSDSSGNLYAFSQEGGGGDNGAAFELLAPATQTVFTTNPGIVNAGTLSSVAVSLETTDGGVVSSDTAQVTLSIASGPGGATLSGTTTVAAVAGVASFTNITFSLPGTYTLAAVSSGLTSATTSVTISLNDAISDLADLSSSTGSNPTGGLYMDSSGNLYGTAGLGGANSDGTVFEIAAGTHAVTTIASFNGTDGSDPEGALVADSSGDLFGTTSLGGSGNNGTVFEIASGTNTITTLALFNWTNGARPSGSLLLDSSGNLFGSTEYGGSSGDGTVFEIVHGSGTITTLASMSSSTGELPEYANVVKDSAGNLYGTAFAAGANTDGTVWKLSSGTLSALVSFNGTNGAYPYGNLSIDSAGNLYGTTETGGANNQGTIFKITAGTSTVTTLASLNTTTGRDPLAGVLVDSSGDVFAPTLFGSGATASGAVVEIPAGSSTINVLADLSSAGGSQPYGQLIIDSSGNLYGTALDGGANNDGLVFEVAEPATQAVIASQPTVVVAGAIPSLTVDLDTAQGTVATIDSSNVTLSVASGPSGGTISGTTTVAAVAGVATFTNLTFSKPGTYTLTASSSGLTSGTDSVTISPVYTLSDIADLSSSTGSSPAGSLYRDSSGNLYGTAASGGTNNDGTVFEIAAGTHAVTTIANFNGTNGQGPEGPVIADSSGDLFGTTGNGGAHNNGTVFEIANGSSTITTLVSFNGSNGGFPTGSLLLDGSGNLYGTTEYGGANSVGTVFEIVHGSGAITTLASMSSSIGAFPDFAGVVEDSSGNFYGTAFAGGANNQGSVWKLSSGTLTTLASFNNTNGEDPFGSLSIDSAGNLYGTTAAGGANGDGTIYKIAAGTGTITTLTSLSGTTGTNPFGGVLLDSSGNIFAAITFGSGVTASGTVIEITANTGTVNVLADLGNANGSEPYGPLIMDSSGNLYGTTFHGGANIDGEVFEEIAPATQAVFTTQPTVVTSGTLSAASVTLETATGSVAASTATVTLSIASGPTGGTLGGTTSVAAVAGIANFTNLTFSTPGTYTLTAAVSGLASVTSNSLTVSHTYSIADITDLNSTLGAAPQAGLYIDSSGNLYGTGNGGGTYGDGTVYKITAGTHIATTIASFNGTNGSTPLAGLIADASGNLYGTTSAGGAYGDGTVYEIASGSSTITTIASFNGTDGNAPGCTLLIDSSGNLYGTTSEGGTSGLGTIFKIAHGSNTITTLASMSDATGTLPLFDGVVMDSSGNLYGTAVLNGSNLDGTVWELAAGSNTLTALVSFNGTNGQHPYGRLTIDSSGNLYGTTSTGGISGDGTVFEIAAGTGNLTTLASLNNTTGKFPNGGVLLDSSGDIFATTSSGSGATGGGTVIEIPAGSTTVNVLADIGGTNASDSYSQLVMDSHGNLYGTTRLGGANSDGNVFEVASTAATHAAFATYPTTTTAGESQTITVTLQSALGVVDTSNNSMVTLAIATGPSGATLGGTLTAAAVNGVAVFSGITMDTAGSYLLAAQSNFPVTTSGTITVFPGSFASIDFIDEPMSAVAGQTLSTVSVGLLDAYGNPIAANQGDFVQLELVANGSESLLGTTQQPLVSGGYETFSNLSIDTADTNDQLLAVSSVNSETVISNTFNITPGAASKLAFVQQPESTVAGQTLNPISVAVEDAYGNIVTTNNSGVVVQNFPMVLNGTISASVSNGIATFSQLYVTQAGTFTINASDWNLTSTNSNSFTVSPAAATQLAFVQQPADAVAGQTLAPIEVAVEDTYGNIVTSNVSGVVVQNNPMVLNGTISASVIDGIATFNQLDVTRAGTWSITAGDASLTPAVSSSFNVTAGAAAQLVITRQPSSVATTGQNLGTVAVNIEDAFDNPVSTDDSDVTITAIPIGTSPGLSVLQGTHVVAAQDGTAVFSNLSISTAGSYTLSATDAALTQTATTAIAVHNDSAHTVLAGVTMPPMTINASTPFGRSIAGSKWLTVTVENESSDNQVLLQRKFPISRGTAAIKNLKISEADDYTLLISDTQGHTMQQTFTVAPAVPARLVFATQPVFVDGHAQVTVQAVDRFGNVVTTDSGTAATLQLSANRSPGARPVLGGTTSATLTDGVAVFADLTLNRSVSGKLIASSGKLGHAVSYPFTSV